MLAHPELPPGLIERCLDVLKEIMPSERDLIRVIVEIVVELREPEGDENDNEEDEPPVSSAVHFLSLYILTRARAPRIDRRRQVGRVPGDCSPRETREESQEPRGDVGQGARAHGLDGYPLPDAHHRHARARQRCKQTANVLCSCLY